MSRNVHQNENGAMITYMQEIGEHDNKVFRCTGMISSARFDWDLLSPEDEMPSGMSALVVYSVPGQENLYSVRYF